jgi:Ser/Thr protein kinase RdoA (MazF antagonist)
VSPRESETPLTGGWVTAGVVRVGETLRRPTGWSTPFVHALLRHLEHVGFDDAPRVLGVDEQEREILTFLEGEVPSDCRAIIWDDRQLAAAARLLRRFHDATAGTELAGSHEVVCHNDFGPWNLVWRQGLPAAIIDFDEAAPGSRMDDLGYALWKHLNLGLVDLAPVEQGRRVRLMTSAYGSAAGHDVLAAIERAQARMAGKIEAATPGDPRAEALAQLRGERHWLETNQDQLQW